MAKYKFTGEFDSRTGAGWFNVIQVPAQGGGCLFILLALVWGIWSLVNGFISDNRTSRFYQDDSVTGAEFTRQALLTSSDGAFMQTTILLRNPSNKTIKDISFRCEEKGEKTAEHSFDGIWVPPHEIFYLEETSSSLVYRINDKMKAIGFGRKERCTVTSATFTTFRKPDSVQLIRPNEFRDILILRNNTDSTITSAHVYCKLAKRGKSTYETDQLGTLDGNRTDISVEPGKEGRFRLHLNDLRDYRLCEIQKLRF
jgi:hypothetical protein